MPTKSQAPAGTLTNFVLRPVIREDAVVLFRWLNATDRRLASFRTSNPVSWPDHIDWLDRHIAESDGWHAIAVHGGQPAGQVRTERDASGVVISIYVDAAFRKLGVGRKLIDGACYIARERWPGLPVLAHVRPDNLASVAFFMRNGFSEAERKSDRIVLRRIP